MRRMWVLFASMSILIAACGGGAADIVLEKQELALGEVVNGEVRTIEIEVKNQGTEDLVIEAVSTSCGCTQAEIIPSTISPGESGILHVQYDSGAHGPEEVGQILRQVFIASNDPDESDVEFRFSAEVLASNQ
jgi:hypothetical protein